MFAVEEWIVGSAVGILVAETTEEAQTVVTTLYDLSEKTSAPQSSVVELVFVVALAADVVTAGETVAAEFVLGTLDVEIAVVAVLFPAVSAVPVVQAALPAVAVELLVPVAVMQAVVVAAVVSIVVRLVCPSE